MTEAPSRTPNPPGMKPLVTPPLQGGKYQHARSFDLEFEIGVYYAFK